MECCWVLLDSVDTVKGSCLQSRLSIINDELRSLKNKRFRMYMND